MSGIYYTDMVNVLMAAGCSVQENGYTDGWQNRARSSGGFAAAPLGIQWHHTASTAAPENDLAWMTDGSDDAPIGNLLLDRTGTFWPIAAGAANTAGKGGPLTMSRGVVPLDSGNSTTFAIEAANNGVGEPWPQVQLDAYFRGSNALNARFGNLPTDVFTHSLGAGDGWTDRKIDPATAFATEGPWRPTGVTSSGTWLLADIRAECARRATTAPPTPPTHPTPDEEYDMAFLIRDNVSGGVALVYGSGKVTGIDGTALPQMIAYFGDWIDVEPPTYQGFIDKSS